MSRLQAWFVHLANLLVAATGIAYALFRYLPGGGDPYAVVRHPLQPLAQHLHLWTAPLVVFAVGLIWQEHVFRHWRGGVRSARRSGLTLLAALTPMVASGYLLQTAVSETWRTVWVGVHLASSGLWIAGYAAHLVAKRRRVGNGDRIRGSR